MLCLSIKFVLLLTNRGYFTVWVLCFGLEMFVIFCLIIELCKIARDRVRVWDSPLLVKYLGFFTGNGYFATKFAVTMFTVLVTKKSIAFAVIFITVI